MVIADDWWILDLVLRGRRVDTVCRCALERLVQQGALELGADGSHQLTPQGRVLATGPAPAPRIAIERCG